MMYQKPAEFELCGYETCLYCNKRFPKEFSDPIVWHQYSNEKYTKSELRLYLGLENRWKNIDEDGQWFFFKNRFICPHCAKKLIENGEAKLVTRYDNYSISCPNEFEKQYVVDYDGWFFEIKIPYLDLVKINKKCDKL